MSDKDWQVTVTSSKSYTMTFSIDELEQILLEALRNKGVSIPEGDVNIYLRERNYSVSDELGREEVVLSISQGW